jgi:hypothetical protein
MGLISEKKLVSLATDSSVSCFLKISIRNGLNIPNDTIENKFEITLQLKYANINFGYLPTYLKIVLKLFIKTIEMLN